MRKGVTVWLHTRLTIKKKRRRKLGQNGGRAVMGKSANQEIDDRISSVSNQTQGVRHGEKRKKRNRTVENK
jgi:hypothetical protein